MNKFKKYGLLALTIVTALVFLSGGIGKLMGIEMMHKSFATLGLPVWFGYFIGACEVLGAIGLFIRSLSSLAAIGLSIIAAGASYYHIMYDPQGTIVAGLLVVFCVVIFISKRKESMVFGTKEVTTS